MSRKAAALSLALILMVVMPVGTAARADHATLIGIDVLRQAAKPGPAAANCSNDGVTGNAYSLTGWEVATSTTTAHLNTATVPNIDGDEVDALQDSFDAWGSLPGVPDITVQTNGTVTKATANHRYDLLWGRTGGSSIAVTYTWTWSNGEIESDTVFNSRLPWFIAASEGDGCVETVAKYDVASIATHEFGHTFGLGHAANDRFETMYPYGYTGETLKRSPESGDKLGIDALY